MKRVVFCVIVALMILTVILRAHAAAQYQLIDLGYGSGLGINNAGQVVGSFVNTSGYGHAFIWDAQNGMQDLGPGQANGINSAGKVVGDGPNGHAFLWDATSGMRDLGTLAGIPSDIYGVSSGANAINDAGQVVGWSRAPDDDFGQACLWDAAGGVHDLSPLTINYSRAFAINNAGQVAGVCSYYQAFLWDETEGMHGLATPGFGSYAYGINDIGQTAGVYFTAVGDESRAHAFIYDAIGGMHEIGPLDSDSCASDINNAGQVVGNSIDTSGCVCPFTWDEVRGMRGLETLGGLQSSANGINDAGQIVGTTQDQFGRYHAVLWQPVPEPSSILALIAGLATIGSMAVSRRK